MSLVLMPAWRTLCESEYPGRVAHGNRSNHIFRKTLASHFGNDVLENVAVAVPAIFHETVFRADVLANDDFVGVAAVCYAPYEIQPLGIAGTSRYSTGCRGFVGGSDGFSPRPSVVPGMDCGRAPAVALLSGQLGLNQVASKLGLAVVLGSVAGDDNQQLAAGDDPTVGVVPLTVQFGWRQLLDGV